MKTVLLLTLACLQLTGLHHHHVKPASRPDAPAAQIHLGRKHYALSFDWPYAGQSTAVTRVAAAAHFHKNHRALRVAHNQIYLAAAASGRAVIALQQLQALVLQKHQRFILGGIAFSFGMRWLAGTCWPFVLKGLH